MICGYFQAVFIFTLHLVAAQPIQYVLVGQTGSLNPELKTYTDGSEILWRHNGDKVVEFNGNEEQVYKPYKDRVTLNWHTAELEITGLTFEDSGDYNLEVYKKKNLHRLGFKLKVIGKLSKPTISCEIVEEGTNSDESGARASLMCSAESRQSESLMKFEWSAHGNTLLSPNLTISLGHQHNDEEYNCTVSNPLSRETTTFTARDCYPEKNSTALIVGICVPIAILLIVGLIVGLMFWKLRHKCVEGKTGIPEEEAFIGGPSTVQCPQPPQGFPTKTDKNMTGNVMNRVEYFEKKNEKGGNPEQQAFIDRQSTFRSPQRLASLAPKTDDTESDPNVTESKKETDDDNETNPAPAHPNSVCPSLSVQPSSPSTLNSSNAPHEGDTDEHQEEANGPGDQENTSQQFDIPKGSKHENSLHHMLSERPNAADDQSDSQSDNDFEDASEESEKPATQQEDQVTEKVILREAESKAKVSEEVLPPDEAKKASTEKQTSEQVEKESHPAKGSQQEEEQSHEDDQQENNQQPESLKSSKQEKHDTVCPDSTTAPEQGDDSRLSSQSESFSEEAEKTDGTPTGHVKKKAEQFQREIDAHAMSPTKPPRYSAFCEFGSSEKESKKDTDDDNETNLAPAHPNSVCPSPSVQPSSPSTLNSSNAPHEGDTDVHQEEANGPDAHAMSPTKPPRHSAFCEFGSSEKESKKDTDDDNETNLAPAHPNSVCPSPSVQPSSPSTLNSSNAPHEGDTDVHQEEANGPGDQENMSQQFDIPKGSKHENSLHHKLSERPNAADRAADDQSDSQSDNDFEDTSEESEKPATQQEDQVTEKAILREAESKAKVSEEVLPPDEAKKASTKKQTSEQVEKESHPAKGSQQEEEQSHEDDQQENNQRPESLKSSKQEKHDTICPDSTTAPEQGGDSRLSSQSESFSEEAEKTDGTPTGHVKKKAEQFQREIDAHAMSPTKPPRHSAFCEFGSSEKESKKDTDDDNETNLAPAHPNSVCPSPSVQPSSPSTLNSSNAPHEGDTDVHQEEAKGPGDQENTSQQFDIPKGSKHENSLHHKLSEQPNAADRAADDQSDSQSDNDFEDTSEETEKPATQQEDQVTEKAILREAESKAKVSEEVLPPDEAKKASTEKQTSEQVEKESHPAKGSQQEEEQSHEDDQQENNQQPESLKSSKQEKHDTICPDSTTAPEQGDNSRLSSQSESFSEEAERGEGESKHEQPKDDASDHGDKANSDQVNGSPASGTDEKIKSGDSTQASPTPEHNAEETREGAHKERDTG